MTAPTVAPVDTETSSDVVHLACDCDPDRSLCGLDIPDDVWITGSVPPEQRCVVCWDLLYIPCPRCGWTHDPDSGD